MWDGIWIYSLLRIVSKWLVQMQTMPSATLLGPSWVARTQAGEEMLWRCGKLKPSKVAGGIANDTGDVQKSVKALDTIVWPGLSTDIQDNGKHTPTPNLYTNVCSRISPLLKVECQMAIKRNEVLLYIYFKWKKPVTKACLCDPNSYEMSGTGKPIGKGWSAACSWKGQKVGIEELLLG